MLRDHAFASLAMTCLTNHRMSGGDVKCYRERRRIPLGLPGHQRGEQRGGPRGLRLIANLLEYSQRLGQ